MEREASGSYPFILPVKPGRVIPRHDENAAAMLIDASGEGAVDGYAPPRESAASGESALSWEGALFKKYAPFDGCAPFDENAPVI